MSEPEVRPAPPWIMEEMVAAQPALLYAYALQGGVNELSTAALAATAAALAAALIREPERIRLSVAQVRHRLEILGAALLFSTVGAAIKATTLSSWQVASFRSGVAALVETEAAEVRHRRS